MFIYTVSDTYIAVCGIILILEQSKLLNTNVNYGMCSGRFLKTWSLHTFLNCGVELFKDSN